MTEILAAMRQKIQQRLPAGLVDDDIEIFTTGDQVYAVLGGSAILFENWPESLKDKLKGDLSENPLAIQALIDLEIETEPEMLWQYARCRFGSFDGRPDIESGKFTHTEFWDCGIRGQCPYEGKLCCSMKMPDGIITPREIQVWRLLVEGMIDKEIADKLGISDTTVPQHVRNLTRKCRVRHRGELIRLGVQLNIQ